MLRKLKKLYKYLDIVFCCIADTDLEFDRSLDNYTLILNQQLLSDLNKN